MLPTLPPPSPAPAPATTYQLQPLQSTGGPPTKPPPPPPRPQGERTTASNTTTTPQRGRMYIDMMALQQAASEPDGMRRKLAIMIWPTDDCTKYASNIECKPTPVFEENGKPAHYPDGRPITSYSQPKACRYCSVWCKQPGQRGDYDTWSDDIKDGTHNPKQCPRALTALLKAGQAGASLVREDPPRRGRNPPGR